MSRFIQALVAAIILLTFGSQAFAGIPPIPPSASPVRVDAVGNVVATQLGNAKLRTVCSNTNENTGTLSPAGQHVNSGGLYYCPQGFLGLAAYFSPVYSNANETKLVNPLPFKLSFAPAFAPWSASTSYVVGQTVTYATLYDGTQSNPFWTVAVDNTNSPPGPNNANWTAVASQTFTNMSCNSGGACQVPTTVDAITGTTYAKATTTDLITNTTCASACYIYVKYVGVVQGAQVHPTGQVQASGAGGYFGRSATLTDYTPTGSFFPANTTYGSSFGPNALLGIPATPSPIVGIRGDSRELGVVGTALSSYALTSGGTGYLVGDVVTSPDTGASADGIAVPFKMVVTNTASGIGPGAVTALAVLTGGAYANAATTGQTNPSGAQAMLGGTGTGLSITPTFSATGGQDAVGGPTGARGPSARAAASLGFPVSKLAVGGDRANLHTDGAQARTMDFAAFAPTTCINELGINDFTVSQTAAQVEANLRKVAAKDRALGCKVVLLVTQIPNPAITDGGRTLAAQTVPGANAEIQAHNAWVRTLPNASEPLFDGFLDYAAVVESTVTPGKLTPNASVPCTISCDGTHQVPAAQDAIAQAIAAKLLQLAK